MAGYNDGVNWPAGSGSPGAAAGRDPGLAARAIAKYPDHSILAAEKNSLDAVRLLIELGFDVNALPGTAPFQVQP